MSGVFEHILCTFSSLCPPKNKRLISCGWQIHCCSLFYKSFIIILCSYIATLFFCFMPCLKLDLTIEQTFPFSYSNRRRLFCLAYKHTNTERWPGVENNGLCDAMWSPVVQVQPEELGVKWMKALSTASNTFAVWLCWSWLIRATDVVSTSSVSDAP